MKTVSVHCHASESRNTVTIVEVAAGSIIFVNVLTVPQPSRYEASSSSLGIFLKNCLNIKM